MEKKKLEKPILAEGETTGHYHILEDENVAVYENEGIREFNLAKATKLIHQEHKIIELPAGEYESGVDNEYDPFENEIKEIRD